MEIDTFYGFSERASQRARAGATIAIKKANGELILDSRGGYNRKLTKEEVDKMD